LLPHDSNVITQDGINIANIFASYRGAPHPCCGGIVLNREDE